VASGFALQLTFLAVLGVGGARVAAGSLDVATLIAFLLYLFFLIGPITAITVGATQLQAGLAAVARIDEIGELDVEAATSTPPDRARRAATAGGAAPVVVFDRVSFAYRPDQPVLREVSFSVARTSQTAIVGPSGIGKSTLLALLERFYEPSKGRSRSAGHRCTTSRATSCARASATSSRTRRCWPGRCGRT
jgi:ABC-type multidrug transport system fused ATPase/permease subunit